jgi:hemerythrin-like domain-containing protein
MSMKKKPTDILEEEHHFIQKVIARMVVLAEALETGQEADVQALRDIVDFMHTFADECHHGKEETNLFPTLEKRGVPVVGCPIGTLIFEHQKGRTLVKGLAEAIEAYMKDGSSFREPLIKSLRSLIELYPTHIWKEEYLLFPMSNKVLTPEDQKELLEKFEMVDKRTGHDVHRRFEEFAENSEALVK